METRKRRKTLAGLSLIELFAVITIAALLMTVALPGLMVANY